MTQALASIGDVLDDENLLGRHFKGPSWDNWKALLRAAFAEPLSHAQHRVFEELAGGRAPPEQRAKEWWTLSGRRSEKLQSPRVSHAISPRSSTTGRTCAQASVR